MEALSGSYACEAPDLPGHGNNPSAILTFSQTAAQLKAQIQAEPETVWVLIGYSLGGRLALSLALDPDLAEHLGALVLISSSPGLKTEAERLPRQAWERQWAEVFREGPLEKAFDAWYAQALFGQLKALPLYAELQTRRLRNSGAALAQSMATLGSGAQALLWAEWPKLKPPCFCLCGGDDPRYLELNREMEARLPQTELQILPGVAHALHLEAPEKTLAALVRFLEKQRPLLK